MSATLSGAHTVLYFEMASGDLNSLIIDALFGTKAVAATSQNRR